MRDLPPEIERRLAEDPAFAVTTADGTGWIDPYTGEIHPVLLDWREHARDHLQRFRPWDLGWQPKPVADLLALRWLHLLTSQLARDDRFRIFAPDRRWLNPYTGMWESGVDLVGERVGMATLKGMAHVLAGCPAAQQGPLLEKADLDRIARTAAERPAAPTTDAYQALNEGMLRARRVLERMLPRMPAVPGWTFPLHYEPQQAIGGDLYDVLAMPDGRILLVLGDVAGHGPDAALVVVSALKAFRFAAPRCGGDVRRLLAEVDDDLRQHHQQFLTVAALDLDPAHSTGTLWLAGHHPGLLVPADGSGPREVGLVGPALGILPGETLARALRPQPLAFAPGDLLLQCTDGLFEVEGVDGAQFDGERVARSCTATLGRPPAETVTTVVEHARRWSRHGRFDDDVTVLAVARAR